MLYTPPVNYIQLAERTERIKNAELTKGANRMQVRVKGDRQHVLNALPEFSVIKVISAETGSEPGTIDLVLAGENGGDIREPIFRCMSKNNFPILLMKSTELSLEEIFLSLTDGDRMGISAVSDFNAAEPAENEIDNYFEPEPEAENEQESEVAENDSNI